MINWIKNLWKKLFGKTEEPKSESKIDVGLQAYIEDISSQTPIIVVDVPTPKMETLAENVSEQITAIQTTVEPIDEDSIKAEEVVKPKRKYTKKAPAKKVAVKKVPAKKTTKAPTKNTPTKKTVTKPTKRNKK